MNGFTGALLATIGIFLRAFFFVIYLHLSFQNSDPLKSVYFFLNVVILVSFTLMLVVCFEQGQKSLVNIPTVLIGIVSLLFLKFTRLNSAMPILAAASIGLFFF